MSYLEGSPFPFHTPTCFCTVYLGMFRVFYIFFFRVSTLGLQLRERSVAIYSSSVHDKDHDGSFLDGGSGDTFGNSCATDTRLDFTRKPSSPIRKISVRDMFFFQTHKIPKGSQDKQYIPPFNKNVNIDSKVNDSHLFPRTSSPHPTHTDAMHRRNTHHTFRKHCHAPAHCTMYVTTHTNTQTTARFHASRDGPRSGSCFASRERMVSSEQNFSTGLVRYMSRISVVYCAHLKKGYIQKAHCMHYRLRAATPRRSPISHCLQVPHLTCSTVYTADCRFQASPELPDTLQLLRTAFFRLHHNPANNTTLQNACYHAAAVGGSPSHRPCSGDVQDQRHGIFDGA